MNNDVKENLLIHGAFADLLHDFGEIVTKKEAQNNQIFREDVYKGLPHTLQDKSLIERPAEFLDSEEAFLKRIFPLGDDFVPNAQSPKPPSISPGFKIGDNKSEPDYYSNLQKLVDFTFEENSGNPKEITGITTNGETYIITQSVVIDKKNSLLSRIVGDKYVYKAPYDILQTLGIQTNSTFVVDFAAVSLPDFLTAPDLTPRDPVINLYFVTNPETENDAAGKTSPTSDFYHNITQTDFKNGIRIHSLQQSESVTQSANYKWTVNDNSAYGQFFTNYTFAISDLIEVKDKKRIKYKTNLVITDLKDPSAPESISDSGNASNITFVKTSIFKRIKSLFSKKDPKDVFFINSKFQHKRSGDWLQVLSCVNLKERAYKQFTDKNGTSSETFDPSTISDVYFVTHDRIALGFALYLGLNAVYTHAATSAYYVFRNAKNVGSQEDRDRRAAEFNEKIIAEATAILSNNEVFEREINQIETRISEYNMLFSMGIVELERQIDSIIMSGLTSDEEIKNIFTLLNRYVIYLNKYQSIDLEKFKEISDGTYLSLSRSLIAQLLAQQPIDVNNSKKLISVYNQCKYEVDKIKQINEDPAIITDEVYEAIMSNWNFIYTLKNYNSPSKRLQQHEEEYKKNLSNIKFNNKNPNPFAVIWTDTLNRLPLHIKDKICREFLDKIYQLRVVDSNPFNPAAEGNDIDKKKYIIYKKLISELLVKFNYVHPLPIGLQGGSKIQGGKIQTVGTKMRTPFIMDESSNLNSKKNYKSKPIKYSKTTFDEELSSNKLKNVVLTSKTNKPYLQEPFYNIQINAANVINEYMSYLSYIYSYKAKGRSSNKSINIGAPLSDEYAGGTLSKKKTLTFSTASRKNILSLKSKKDTKRRTKHRTLRRTHFMTLRKKKTMTLNKTLRRPNFHMTLRDRSHDSKVEIKVHELFTEHSYILLNHILLQDYPDPEKQILHPLLPIFMLSEALSIVLDLNHDADLREDYYHYFLFIRQLYYFINSLPLHYYHIFGLFLRELLFYNTIKLINTPTFFKITHQLTNYISGNIYNTHSSFDANYNSFLTEIDQIITPINRNDKIPHMQIIKDHNIGLKLSIQKTINEYYV